MKRRPRQQPVTAGDVAKMAGVSRSAVSRTFTEGASVSPATREVVTAAAQALGYRPNLIARSLITGRSNIIGFILTHFDNQFYPPLLQDLSIRLGAEGYRLLLFVIDIAADFGPVLDEVLRHRVEALIMASVTLSGRRAQACRDAGLPVLLLNHRTSSEDFSTVTGDNVSGARAVADFLAAGEHRSFAVVTGLDHSAASRDRKDAFQGRLAELGLPAPRLLAGDYQPERARAAARELLSQPQRPDAIFCCNDHMALAVMGVAREEFGLTVGRDISIVGFDDAPIGAWPEYRLTTYSQPIASLVDSTARILHQMLAGEDEAPIHEIVSGDLIVRASARLPTSGLVLRDDGQQVWRAKP